MRLSTASIFSLSCFAQAQILRFTVQLLSAVFGTIAIAQPGSANTIDFLEAANTSTPILSKPSIMLAQLGVVQPSQTLLYVNSTDGSDTENGSDRTPFKTITHALKAAKSGTTIFLAPGTYDTETGEVFPLVLKAGVTLQGDSTTRGQEILIRGGGASTHKAWMKQSVTIEITAPATLKGVTVTNPNSQGYGVAIDAGNSSISDSTFTGNSRGILITGNSVARIQNNYFYQNSIAGIEVAEISQPTIQDNILEQNGSAVTVSDRAAPLIANNRITQNQNGMVFQRSAQPKVRNNSVEGNRQHGLIAQDEARPDLGTAAHPGGNFFRNNGLYDVNVKAITQAISAAGNEWLTTVGTLSSATPPSEPPDSATGFPVPTALSSNSSPEPPRPMQIVRIAMPSTPSQQAIPSQPVNSVQVASSLQPSSKSLNFTPIIAKSSLSKPLPVAALTKNEPIPAQVQNLAAIAIPSAAMPQIAATVPLLETFPQPPSTSTRWVRPVLANPATPKPSQENQLALSPSITAIPISIPVPPPETSTLRFNREARPTRSVKAMVETPKSAQNISATLLPVPSPNVPLGKIGEMPSVYSMRGVFQPSFTQNTTFSSSDPKANTIRFRVVVTIRQSTEQAQVLALVPDAFSIASTNNMMMQVGAFSDRAKAEQLTQILASQGISSAIEPINQ